MTSQLIAARAVFIGVFTVVLAGATPAVAATCCADCNNDGQVTINELIRGVNLALTGDCTPSPDAGGGLLQTGQTTCYDSAGSETPCAGTGQDGEGQEGASFSYTDNGDGTVTDNVTGLMWEKLADDGSVHDKDNRYTWAEAFDVKIATLNADRFAGHTDWRLPNLRELQSLVDVGRAGPSTALAFDTTCTVGCTPRSCSCTISSVYWSSTTYENSPANSWAVYFNVGIVNTIKKSDAYYVRAVRGGS